MGTHETTGPAKAPLSKGRHPLLRAILNTGIALGTILLALLLTDRLLGLLRFPHEVPEQVAHPPNAVVERVSQDFQYEFRTNGMGIRYPEIPLQKPPGEFRVVVIGDSITEGWGIPNIEDTFTGRLEKRFSTPSRNVRFINCGLAGVGFTQYGITLLGVGLRYHPDMVILAVHANDLVGSDTNFLPLGAKFQGPFIIPREVPRRGLSRTLHSLVPRLHTMVLTLLDRWEKKRAAPSGKGKDVVGELMEKARERGASEEFIRAWRDTLTEEDVRQANELGLYQIGGVLFRPTYGRDTLEVATPQMEAQWRNNRDLLVQIILLCRRKGIPLRVLFLPIWTQYGECDPVLKEKYRRMGIPPNDAWRTEEVEYERRIRVTTEGMGVPYLSLTPAFRVQEKVTPNALHFPKDGHPTAAGHRLIAEEVGNWLEGALPPAR